MNWPISKTATRIDCSWCTCFRVSLVRRTSCTVESTRIASPPADQMRTADGGALVFFATHRFEKETAAAGTEIPAPGAEVQALTKGEIDQSLTLEFVSNQVVIDPLKGSGRGQVSVLGRVEGLTGAKGE